MFGENKKFQTRLTVFVLLNIIGLTLWFTLFYYLKNQRDFYIENAQAYLLEQSKEDNARSLKRLMEETEKDRMILDSYFVREDETEMAGFLTTIESLASKAMVAIDIISASKEDDNSLILSLQTNGSFQKTYNFISLVESLPTKLFIRKISLKLKDDGDGQTEWHAFYELKLLSFLPNKKR